MIKKEMNHMTNLTPDLEKEIETLFNDAVGDGPGPRAFHRRAVENMLDENLTDSGTMNWDRVFADVWMDLKYGAAVGAIRAHPELEYKYSASRPETFQTEVNDLLEHMADAWEEARWDRIFDSTEPMESYPW